MPFGILGPLQINAFSAQPFTFVEQSAHDDIAACYEIHLLENGSKEARNNWQLLQLSNLARYASEKSTFWKIRLSKKFLSTLDLSVVPMLSRKELQAQVASEGAICPKENLIGANSYSSSGSTGTPVSVYAMPQNARYNEIRSMAQYFIEGRSLNFNRTFIKPVDGKAALNSANQCASERLNGWAGNIGSIFKHGIGKIIQYDGCNELLINELRKDPVGYLACLGSHMDILLREGGVELIKELGVHMWLHHSDNFDEAHRHILKEAGVKIRSSYSCTEVGPVAVECTIFPGHYHVAHSNVIVEPNRNSSVMVNGETANGLLLTHLHSYATPIIRYEVGDFACVRPSCPCGHDGTTLSNIFGRKKYCLKEMDGSLLPFPLFSKPLLDLCSFEEFFSYQAEDGGIVLVVGGRDSITDREVRDLTTFLKKISQNKFKVTIKAVKHIDWSKNLKRLPFISYFE
jgi:phenylacetate-coenzyme A ligase PaaK-like adenylate-forming protein